MGDEAGRSPAMEYLQADHRRLDVLIEACRAAAVAGEIDAAVRHFTEFRAGLLRHIRIEEELLFPEFEAATGLGPSIGPTAVMRYEHEEIARLVGLIHDLFAGAEPGVAEFERLHDTLMALLRAHTGKEERVLYPMTDRMVPAERLKHLSEHIASLP